MRPTEKKIQHLIKNLNDQTQPELDRKILDDCFTELDNQKSSEPTRRRNIWRIIMKSTKLSTAAAASILLIIGLYHLVGPGTSIAFANAMHHFVAAQTARFDLTVEFGDQEPQTSSFLYDAKGYIRQDMADGTVNFVDYNTNKVLSLVPNSKIVVIRNINNPDFHTALYDIFARLQNLIQEAIDLGHGPVETLGTKIIDGRTAYGFCIETDGQSPGLYWQGKGTLTLWTDAETDFPLSLKWHHSMTDIMVTISNIQLNAVLTPEESSITVPEGYAIQDETLAPEGSQTSCDDSETASAQSLSNEMPVELLEGLDQTDRKLIKFFHGWTVLTKGKFPSSLTTDAIKDIDPNGKASLKQERWAWNISFSANLNFLDDSWKSGIDPNDYTTEEKEQLKEKSGRYYEDLQDALNKKLETIKPCVKDIVEGFEMINSFPADSDWHYNGKDVTLDEADTAIFWYRPQNADMYRAIYGDLRIEDVAPKDLHLLETPSEEEIDRNAKDVLEAAIQLGADIPKDKRAVVLRMLSLKENDLIKGLSIWLELLDGNYPDSLEPEAAIKQSDALLTAKYYENNQPLQGKEEELKEKTYALFFASAFYDKLIREKRDIVYYGDKLTVKDSNKVLVRWKISKHQYRVVFGNLTRKTVTAEQLSELEKPPLQ